VGNTTERLDSHAAASLRYIRSSMEGAVLLAVPGSAGIVLGTIGLLAAALCSAPALRRYWLGIWLGAALIGTVMGSILIVRESSLRDLRLAGTPLLKFALSLAPSLGAGLVMTAVHWYAGNLHAIPGTWLLLYGCALVAASAATTRIIATLGALFILFGLSALLLGDDLQILMLGAGFGGLHMVFGFLIRRMSHGRQA
jgi:Na+/melibiose symporter-like transporter